MGTDLDDNERDDDPLKLGAVVVLELRVQHLQELLHDREKDATAAVRSVALWWCLRPSLSRSLSFCNHFRCPACHYMWSN